MNKAVGIFNIIAVTIFGALAPSYGGNPTQAGNIIINGGTGLVPYVKNTEKTTYNGNTGKDETKSYSINVDSQYVLIDNLAIGISAGYLNSKNTDTSGMSSITYTYKYTQWSAGPIATFFFPVASNLAPYIKAGYFLGKKTSEFEYSGSSSKAQYDIHGFGIGAGINFFFNDYFGMYVEFAYSRYTGDYINSPATSTEIKSDYKRDTYGAYIGLTGIISFSK